MGRKHEKRKIGIHFGDESRNPMEVKSLREMLPLGTVLLLGISTTNFDPIIRRVSRIPHPHFMGVSALLSAFLSLSLLCDSWADEHAEAISAINDGAAYLAGESLPYQSDHPLTSLPSWQTQITQLGNAFASHRDRVLLPMSTWATSEVVPLETPNGTVRYLFSGPDILHAFSMFPTAGTFILCGLEPVGRAPDIKLLTASNASAALEEMRHSLAEIIQFSFFRTKDMKTDLSTAIFPGTVPVITVFLVKSGQYIQDIEFLRLGKDGALYSMGLNTSDREGAANGVRIVFSPRDTDSSRTLYYFSADLSNGGFDAGGIGPWLSTQAKGSAYLKAASFLMHNDWFSKVRNHLLEYSDQIVEDDSGIPYRFFDPSQWEAHLYGVYTGPIDLFKPDYQADLAAAYQGAAKPLPFGTGYKWRRGESNLMRFVRRDRSAVPQATPADAMRANTLEPSDPTDQTGTGKALSPEKNPMPLRAEPIEPESTLDPPAAPPAAVPGITPPPGA